MAGEGRERRFRSALSHRDYRFLLSSLAISDTGNWLYAAATIIYILDATGSAAWVGAAAVVRLLPYILFEPLGGAIADKYDRRKLMIVLDLARAGVMLHHGRHRPLGLEAGGRRGDRADVRQQRLHRAVLPGGHRGDPFHRARNATSPPPTHCRARSTTSRWPSGLRCRRSCCCSDRCRSRSRVNAATFLLSAFLVSRMRVHGKVGEVEAESSLFQQIASGARAIRGSQEAICWSGWRAPSGSRSARRSCCSVPSPKTSLDLGYDATGWLFAAPGVGGIVVVALAAQAGQPGTHRSHPHRRHVRRRASR